MKKPTYPRKHYRPLLAKTLRNSLAQRIAEQFPRIGGDRIVGACADLVLEVVWAHLKPLAQTRHIHRVRGLFHRTSMALRRPSASRLKHSDTPKISTPGRAAGRMTLHTVRRLTQPMSPAWSPRSIGANEPHS